MTKFLLAAAGVGSLAVLSLFVGATHLSPATLLAAGPESEAMRVLLASRIPRTIAVILSGMAMGVSGLIMQLIVRNHFVEPGTAGTVESASLGILLATLLAPGIDLIGKMMVAALCALAGTALFLVILSRIPLRSALLVPLIGLMLGGIFDSVTTFFAYRYDLLQSLNAWTTGDFSGVLRGRYELLWIAFGLTAAAYLAADRFTVAGMGRAFTTNLGMNYRRAMSFGLIIVSMSTAVVVATVGTIPFLGLIVPNLVSMGVGDNARRAVPWVALGSAAFVLVCDLIGRTVRHPYEIPVGTIVGVVGSALFLYLLLRKGASDG
ncbi:ABC transporter permease [Skermanella mucosa]|uniref:ABC transporter permease n=1 Tax=Skermanella mucosa TaxID=1789672 RepID=UPI00192B6F81|nr:ABC transporter permease [Skermanella mucosa]UEM19181.1 ABC transporter permease [Skermanella mucosa]